MRLQKEHPKLQIKIMPKTIYPDLKTPEAISRWQKLCPERSHSSLSLSLSKCDPCLNIIVKRYSGVNDGRHDGDNKLKTLLHINIHKHYCILPMVELRHSAKRNISCLCAMIWWACRVGRVVGATYPLLLPPSPGNAGWQSVQGTIFPHAPKELDSIWWVLVLWDRPSKWNFDTCLLSTANWSAEPHGKTEKLSVSRLLDLERRFETKKIYKN